MGFGNLIDAGAQNALTNTQTSVNTIGGAMQQSGANAQATALQQEASNAFETAQVNAGQALIQGKQAYGQQAEAYASSGVTQTGSPLAMLNQTRMETEQQVNMIQTQGRLQQSLYGEQADQAQQQGLAEWLSSQGQNQVSQQQNQINQFEQTSQLIMSFLGMGTGFAGGALDAFIAKK